MNEIIPPITLRQAALTAGWALLIMTIAAVAATDLTIGSLVVPDDAAATTDNIKNSDMVFRLGIFSWTIVLICDVLAAWGLYVFLEPVNKSLSLLTAWLRLVYGAMLGVSIYNFVYVLLLINPDYSMLASDAEQLFSQVAFFLRAFDDTWSLGLIVFGLHILGLGYLVMKSDYVPSVLGGVMILGAVGYIIINLSRLLFPQFENSRVILEWIFILPMLGEVALGVWLLWKGKNVVTSE